METLYVFAFSYLCESIVNAVKMKHKLSFTETLHYSQYEFFNRFNCLFCLVFMFLSLIAPRSGNVLLGFRMRYWISLYHWGKRLSPSGTQTHTNTLTDEVMLAWNSISFPRDLMQDLVKGAARLLTKHLKWMQFSSLTHVPSTALKVGVCTELYAHLFSPLMILFLSFIPCGQKKEIGQLASCFCAYSFISIY